MHSRLHWHSNISSVIWVNDDHHKEANVCLAGVPEVNLSKSAKLIGLEQIASGRYSVLLAANLLGGVLSGVQNPFKMVHEIELLEKNKLSQFKPPIRSRHPSLKGLCHTHCLQDGIASFAENVKKKPLHLPQYAYFFKFSICIFQDLRHKGVSRLFEMDWDIPSFSGRYDLKSWRRHNHLLGKGD